MSAESSAYRSCTPAIAYTTHLQERCNPVKSLSFAAVSSKVVDFELSASIGLGLRRALCSLIASAVAVGCAPQLVAPPESTADLLSGHLLFGEAIATAAIDTEAIMALDDSMRRFVAEKVGDDPQARSRLEKLIGGMIDDGLLTLDYDPNLTYTATETFRNRQGNCLSFSILFAALAREAELEATFQMVDIPPSYSADGDTILLNNHINIIVNGVRSDVNFFRSYVVDFNTAEYSGNYDTRKVSDTYAISLYLSNVGVEAMQSGNHRRAFRYLKKAIETYPGIPGPWVNLGVLYSRNGHYELAEQAYRQALSLKPSDRSALVNLASVLRKLGREGDSKRYQRWLDYYRDRNPYYHYSLAQTAYRQQRYADALVGLEAAIRLKADEHQFYHLRGLVHYGMGHSSLAARDFEKARDVAETPRADAAYARKLRALDLAD